MNFKLAAGLAACLISASPAFAAPITLDFEGATSFSSINDFYNGGTDGAGAPGTNWGVSFGGSALALSNDGDTFYSNAPSNGTILNVFGTDGAMNRAGGFAGEASFSYSSTAATTVGIYSGLNGTGSLLGEFSLTANAQDGCSDSAFCHWDPITVAFNGIAQSIQFSGVFDAVNGVTLAGIDDVTIAPVPLPAGLLLLPSGLALLGLSRRRKTAA